MLSADHCLVLVCDQCADALVGQHLQQHRMSNTAVDDVRAGDAVLHRRQGAVYLWQHPASDGPIGDEGINLRRT